MMNFSTQSSKNVVKQKDIRNSPYNFRGQYWYNDPSKPATYGKNSLYLCNLAHKLTIQF
jgi:hypothetical protein